MQHWLKKFSAGCLIGLGAIIPGVSGGVIAMALGLYEPILKAASGFFRSPGKNIRRLAPIALGAGLSAVAFSGAISWLLGAYRRQVLFLFIGLVCGSVPSFLRAANRNGFKACYLLAAAPALLLVLLMQRIPPGAGEQAMDFSMLVLSGAILAVGIIVPGISASFILLYLGTYEGILKGLATGAFDVLTPVGIGFLAAAVLCVKALAYLFEHYHEYAYYTSLEIGRAHV